MVPSLMPKVHVHLDRSAVHVRDRPVMVHVAASAIMDLASARGVAGAARAVAERREERMMFLAYILNVMGCIKFRGMNVVVVVGY